MFCFKYIIKSLTQLMLISIQSANKMLPATAFTVRTFRAPSRLLLALPAYVAIYSTVHQPGHAFLVFADHGTTTFAPRSGGVI